ncbi:hypothetical protein DY000_02014431 [Brassica cretica]|uniref:Uncharacterized protein n=1 Tax=Brassica cretica TaxID=69181 RepID=A0ABQ7CZK6_BRACR|nr:hypothetical protein DY000_02014431 [Brassica cretica]
MIRKTRRVMRFWRQIEAREEGCSDCDYDRDETRVSSIRSQKRDLREWGEVSVVSPTCQIDELDGVICPTSPFGELDNVVGPTCPFDELDGVIGPTRPFGELDNVLGPTRPFGDLDNVVGPTLPFGELDDGCFTFWDPLSEALSNLS